MAEPTQIVSETIGKFTSGFTGFNWLTIVGWIIFILVASGGGFWVYIYYKNKRIFNKNITAFEIVGGHFEPAIRDQAKVIKIGRGGFEILYLKKSKTWKIGYGGKVGKNTYYFFIMPDGYWYNGLLSANLNKIDKDGGFVPIVTTNPMMRGQYTALEKQIDSLNGEKVKFWDKYGGWVMAISFVLIAGVMLWLNYRQYATSSAQFNSAMDKLVEVMTQLARISESSCSQNTGGLIPVR